MHLPTFGLVRHAFATFWLVSGRCLYIPDSELRSHYLSATYLSFLGAPIAHILRVSTVGHFATSLPSEPLIAFFCEENEDLLFRADLHSGSAW